MRALLFILLIAALSACAKNAGPSPEFTKAHAALEATISQTLDPSYADPRFDRVEKLFRAVPEDAPDREKALGFADQIRTRRSAVGADLPTPGAVAGSKAKRVMGEPIMPIGGSKNAGALQLPGSPPQPHNKAAIRKIEALKREAAKRGLLDPEGAW